MNLHESNPFDQVRKMIRRLSFIGAIFMTLIALISVSGVSIAWYAVHQTVQENKQRLQTNTQLILAMCRMNNEQNLDIIIAALDLGVPPASLTAFNPINCTAANIERKFGRP